MPFRTSNSSLHHQTLSMRNTAFVSPILLQHRRGALPLRRSRSGRPRFQTAPFPLPRQRCTLKCTREVEVKGVGQAANVAPETEPYQVRDWLFKSFRVQYAVAGEEDAGRSSKPAVILVHGFGANCQHWRKNLKPLADNGWRVYAMDLLGFGMGDKPTPGTLDSDGDPVMYNFDYWSVQLKAFVQDIVKLHEDERAFFVANSIGSMVTMQVAVETPELCAAQVFISPSLRQLNVRKRSWVQDIAAPIFMKILSYRPLGAFFLNSLARPDQLRRVLREAYEVEDAVDDELIDILGKPAYTDGALDVFLAFIMYDDGPIPEDFLGDLTQPSMIIWGEEDRFEPIVLGEALRHYSIIDQFVKLPDVGHCAHDELPSECNVLISEFVKTNIDRVSPPLA